MHTTTSLSQVNGLSSTQNSLDVSVDGELTSGDSSNHDSTSTNTGERATDTELLTDLDETGDGTLSWETLGLVDLAEHGVGWLGNNGSGNTSNETRAQVNGGLGSGGGSGLVDALVDGLSDLLVDDELGHGVWNLLEQDGAETSVESANTLVLQHLGETTNETVGIGWLRDKTDTGGLERAESDIGEELGKSGGTKVDSCSVLTSSLVTKEVDGLLLEQFITSELEGTLKEVTSSGWAKTGQESTSTLVGDDLTETTDETLVVGDGVKLDSGLDAERKIHVSTQLHTESFTTLQPQ